MASAYPEHRAAGAVNSGPISVEAAPQTLYFLAVGCNGSVTLEGAIAGGGLSNPLVGVASGLVSPFNTASPITITAGGSIPNVYAGPRAPVRCTLSSPSRLQGYFR